MLAARGPQTWVGVIIDDADDGAGDGDGGAGDDDADAGDGSGGAGDDEGASRGTNDTCAWTPNKVFMRLGSLGTWAWVPGLSASACRRALRAKRPSTMTVLGTGPVLIH